MRALAVCQREGGQVEAAEETLLRALSLAEAELEPKDQEIAALLSSYGSVSALLKKYDVAEAALLRCHEIRSATLEPGDQSLLLVRSRLAELYDKTDRPNLAAKYRRNQA
jgi:hypothetical protein